MCSAHCLSRLPPKNLNTSHFVLIDLPINNQTFTTTIIETLPPCFTPLQPTIATIPCCVAIFFWCLWPQYLLWNGKAMVVGQMHLYWRTDALDLINTSQRGETKPAALRFCDVGAGLSNLTMTRTLNKRAGLGWFAEDNDAGGWKREAATAAHWHQTRVLATGFTLLGPNYTTGFTLLGPNATMGFTLLGPNKVVQRKEVSFPAKYPDHAESPKKKNGMRRLPRSPT